MASVGYVYQCSFNKDVLVSILRTIFKICLTACLVTFLLVNILEKFEKAKAVTPAQWPEWTIHPQKIKYVTRIKNLNQSIPSFDALVAFKETGRTFEERELSSYVNYYKNVIAMFPSSFEAYHLLGLFYYQQNDFQKSIEAYQHSIYLNPHFFSSYYNLGILFFKARRYKQSEIFFRKALAAEPEANLKIIYSSKIYQQILSFDPRTIQAMEKYLQEGYQSAYLLLEAGLKQTNIDQNTDLRVY